MKRSGNLPDHLPILVGAGLILVLLFPSFLHAFDYRFEARTRFGGFLILDEPRHVSNLDSEAELRLGVLGTALEKEDWALDYEIVGDLRHEGGALEQAGLAQNFEADFFRAWARIDYGNFKIRGGRQQILFGASALFRPLGFFDNRNISGVIPQTNGVDGLRLTWFPTGASLVEGWMVPSRSGSKVISGFRGERQFGILEVGAAFQYKPESDISFLNNFGQELTQTGFHIKGEKEIGFWNETRLDIQQINGNHPLRVQTVSGVDYTFDVGQGLHLLLEYSLTTQEDRFTLTDIKGDRTQHLLGFQMDQPIGISTIWRNFIFFDLRDRSFQIVPQIEYAITDSTYLYFQGQFGGSIDGDNRTGRLFRRGVVANGTESRLGFTLITFF